MTPAPAHLEEEPRSSEPSEAPQVTVMEPESVPAAPASPGRDESAQPTQVSATPARLFLDRIGLIEKMAPIRDLNREIKLEHPQLDNLYSAVENDPEIHKRFLKFANAAWFNSRIQVDSPLMAFTRFGTQGFYRLILATFLQGSIGELSTKFKIWPHLEWSARAGEMMARQVAPKYIDQVFAAGLLHDAVIPSMERELQDYLYFLECALDTDPIVTGLESSCHNFDHAQAAAELARALDFEEAVIEAIAGHHNENMSAASTGDARAILGLLLTTKRALSIVRGQKKNAFESATEKALLREIATALNVSSGRIVHAVGDVVDLLHLPTA
jgi:HD-like signal output (HDOD) protein